jgi:hypothetical protein
MQNDLEFLKLHSDPSIPYPLKDKQNALMMKEIDVF